MAGFGKAKSLQVQEEEAEELASTPVTQRTDSGAYAALKAEFEKLNAGGPKTHIFMGIVGHENTGKTGIVFDFFQKYCDEVNEVIEFE